MDVIRRDDRRRNVDGPSEANHAEHRSVEARDLLERVPPACVAFTGDEGRKLNRSLFSPRAIDGLPSDCFWFEVQPTRTVAWDYGRIREVDDES